MLAKDRDVCIRNQIKCFEPAFAGLLAIFTCRLPGAFYKAFMHPRDFIRVMADDEEHVFAVFAASYRCDDARSAQTRGTLSFACS